MIVNNITLDGFRNYRHTVAEFSENVNIIIGENAQGKTNLLESIFYLTSGRSFRSRFDRELIGFDRQNAEIEANILSGGRKQKLCAKLHQGRGKQFFINGVKCKTLSELSGKLTAVIFSPDDLSIIKDGAAVRRRLMDSCISQLRPRYASALAQFHRLYEGKNRILRDFHEKPSLLNTLDDYNEQMAKMSAELIYYRSHFIKKLSAAAEKIHYEFSGNRERLTIVYQTVKTIENPQSSPAELFPLVMQRQKELRQAEIDAGLCLCGAHKDDLEIDINGSPAKNFASQGQTRTAALSIKLAEREIHYADKGEYPVLLLDDVLSELDPIRQNFVLNRIRGGQIFITCCEQGQISKLTGGKILRIQKGEIQ